MCLTTCVLLSVCSSACFPDWLCVCVLLCVWLPACVLLSVCSSACVLRTGCVFVCVLLSMYFSASVLLSVCMFVCPCSPGCFCVSLPVFSGLTVSLSACLSCWLVSLSTRVRGLCVWMRCLCKVQVAIFVHLHSCQLHDHARILLKTHPFDPASEFCSGAIY